MDVITRDLKDMDITWEDAEELTAEQIEQDGVNVWPNVPAWMRDEPRSKVKIQQ